MKNKPASRLDQEPAESGRWEVVGESKAGRVGKHGALQGLSESRVGEHTGTLVVLTWAAVGQCWFFLARLRLV